MRLFVARSREWNGNSYYARQVNLNGVENLRDAARYDHIYSECRSNHRGEEDFISCDGIILDLDNTHSDDPPEWQELGDIADCFDNVHFFWVRSRNYMREKIKAGEDGNEIREEPRPKWHLYFPLRNQIRDYQSCKELILTVAGLFPFFDLGAADPVHMFYGVADPVVGEIEGEQYIDDYISQLDKTVTDKRIVAALDDYQEKISAGYYRASKKWLANKDLLLSIRGLGGPASAGADGRAQACTEDQAKSVAWLKGWAADNDVELGKEYRINAGHHAGAVAFPVRCPWIREHSVDGGPRESVIIIDADGRLNYLCRHDSCSGRGWSDYRRFFDGEKQKQKVTVEDGRIVPVKRGPKLMIASEVTPEPVRWLWQPYLIDANINAVGGETGTGKTWLLAALMASVTAGQPDPMPGRICRTGRVLYLGGEDGNGVIAERLRSVGANLNRISLVEDSFDISGPEFKDMIDSVDPVLVVIDPLLSFVPKNQNPNSYVGARQVMDPLRELARERGICIVAVIHPSKKEDYRLIHRFSGSGGFVDSVRAATYIGYHPTERRQRVGIQPKNNAADSIPFVFELDPELGFSWIGEDSTITVKQVEAAEKMEGGGSSMEYYVHVVQNTLRLCPDGFYGTASDFLNKYREVRSHNIEPAPFGRALNQPAFRDALARVGISLRGGAKTGGKQKYHLDLREHEQITIQSP